MIFRSDCDDGLQSAVNHAVHFPDTIAFHITGGGNRLSGCYIDGGRAIFTGSGLSTP